MREQIRDRERLRHILAAIERVKRYVQGKTYLSITHIGDGLHAITDVFLPGNLEESGKEVIFADRKEKGKINMEVNMTEQNKQYRLTSLEEPTDEMLFELMAGVENIAKISSAKAEAEKNVDCKLLLKKY